MARLKNTVEYFPFYVKDGKTLYILQKKYGLAGIGFFTQLFRYLSQVPDHWMCLDEEIERMRFLDYIGIDEDKCNKMLDVLSESGKIDNELWREWKVVVSQDFLDSLDRVYSKRNIGQMTVQKVREYIIKSGTFRHFPALSGNDKKLSDSCENLSGNSENLSGTSRQKKVIKERKGKESIVKKRKGEREENTPSPPFDNKNSEKEKHLDFVYLSQGEYNALLVQYSEDNVTRYIKKMNNYIGGLDPIKRSVWEKKGHYYQLVSWMEKDNIEKLNDRSPPNVCSVCGKKYSYSPEKDICIECINKQVKEERSKVDLKGGKW